MPNITFSKIASTEPVERYIANVITRQLEGNKRVLWLVPGGSAIKVAVNVAKLLDTKMLKNLTVSLTDERFGKPNHANSNWQQLKAAGFTLPGATMQPVLSGKNLEQTAKEYSQLLEDELEKADYSLALAGMGADGHIFGIKPSSPSVESSELAIGYEWKDYTRLTMTASALKKLDEIVIYAVGQEKWPQLDALQEQVDPNTQPAQILKNLKKVIIFNNHIGEPA